MSGAQSTTKIFSNNDKLLQDRNLVGVPIQSGTKRPALSQWQAVDGYPTEKRVQLRDRFANAGIGVLAGTPISDATNFGFIDVDAEGFVAFVQAVLGPPLSAKFGSKGLTFFCQVARGIRSTKLKVEGSSAPAVEIFATTGQTVLPPTRHPSGIAYKWHGEPLYEVLLEKLPFLDVAKYSVIRHVVLNPHAAAIVGEGAAVKAHDLMLKLTASGVANVPVDLEWLGNCLNALLAPGYEGDTREQTFEMLRTARAKMLGKPATLSNNKSYEPRDVGPVPLGYTRDGNYAFRDQVRKLIITASANQLLSMQYLLGLASSDFWARQFPSEKGMFNFMLAGERLIKASKAIGPFDPARVRGRGVWLDNGQVVVNLGGPTPVDGEYQYLCFQPITLVTGANFDAERLLNYLKRFNWRDPNDAILLLGWFALAPICGALNWRPHSFVYGPPKCGKTTIHSLAAHLLAPLVISTDGQSSEAGVRQKLGPDSLAVIMDEFESDQRGSSLRGVLRLARSASSADNAVLRGTPEGKAMEFSLRTTFYFSAVTPGRMSPADQSRIVLLELMNHDGNEEVARQLLSEERYFRSLGPSWCSHMIALADKIRPALDVFERVIPSTDRRHRQNFAALYAGAFLALHQTVPAEEQAKAWVANFAPSIVRHEADIERDSSREALDQLFSHVVEGYPLGHWASLGMTLGPEDAHYHQAERIMRMFDFLPRKTESGTALLIRNGSPKIEEIFRNSMYEGGGWQRAIRALDGAFSLKDPVYFPGAGTKCRCVAIPAEFLPEALEMPSNDSSDAPNEPRRF